MKNDYKVGCLRTALLGIPEILLKYDTIFTVELWQQKESQHYNSKHFLFYSMYDNIFYSEMSFAKVIVDVDFCRWKFLKKERIKIK